MKLFRRYPSVFASLLMSALVSGCTTSSYLGIALTPGAADPAIQELAERARSGHKQAQLELGIAFEEGRGVPRDKQRALALYRLAGSDSGGATWAYVPPAGSGTVGRVIPVRTGLRMSGLPEAKRRMEALDE